LLFPARSPVPDRSTNASAYLRRATPSAGAGSSMRSSMTRPTPPGLVITRSWRLWNSGGIPAQNALLSHGQLVQWRYAWLSRRGGSLLSTAHPCSLAAPLAPLPLTSPLPAWAIPTVWFQLVFALATHRLRPGMSFSSRSIAPPPAA